MRGCASSKRVTSSTNVVQLEPAFIHVQTAPVGVQSKFERLYQTAPAITGNNTTTLAEYVLLPAVLSAAAETESLREIVAALGVLTDVRPRGSNASSPSTSTAAATASTPG